MARLAATYGLALILAVGTPAVSLGQESPDTQADLDGRLAKAADYLSKGHRIPKPKDDERFSRRYPE